MSNAIQKGVGLSKISFFGQFQEGGDRDASNFIFGGESVYVGQNFVLIVIQNQIKLSFWFSLILHVNYMIFQQCENFQIFQLFFAQCDFCLCPEVRTPALPPSLPINTLYMVFF